AAQLHRHLAHHLASGDVEPELLHDSVGKRVALDDRREVDQRLRPAASLGDSRLEDRDARPGGRRRAPAEVAPASAAAPLEVPPRAEQADGGERADDVPALGDGLEVAIELQWTTSSYVQRTAARWRMLPASSAPSETPSQARCRHALAGGQRPPRPWRRGKART